MRLKYANVILTSLLLMLILTISCKQKVGPLNIKVTPGYIKEDKIAVEQKIDEFHSRYNSEDYDSIYNNSIQEFQKSLSKSDMFEVLKSEHEEAGNFKNVIDRRINLIIGAPVQIRAA